MPRTIAVDCPGCPPLRVLTTDVLGLVKVVEARGKSVIPKVVETWGQPDASSSVLAASLADRENNPVLAIARRSGLIEFRNSLNGDILASAKVSEESSNDLEEDPLVGLHLLDKKQVELASRAIVFLTCSEKGKACLRSIDTKNAPKEADHIDSVNKWQVSNSGNVLCSSIHGSGNHCLFGGKGIEVNIWDLNKFGKIWTAKSPPSNSLGIFTPTWFTAATFLSKEDHRKIAAGTNNHQVRLYDISSQRRPVLSVSFRESSIKAVTADLDGYTIYVGTGRGDLASFDMRTGKLLGCFIGKCSGSIRSIARHPKLPVIASCGLDSYLRVWDVKTRQLLSAVFLKQHLTNVVIDSHFSGQGNSADKMGDSQVIDQSEGEDNEVLKPESKKTKDKAVSIHKARKNKDHFNEGYEDEDEDLYFQTENSKKSRQKDKSKVKTMKSRNMFSDVDQACKPSARSFNEPADDKEKSCPKRRYSSDKEELSRRHKEKKSKKNLGQREHS